MPSMPEPCAISFAGHSLVLDRDGALYWPEQQCLIVSDLHLEKASFLSQFGAPLPCYDTTHTLSRLAALIERYRPVSVVCLGDSFHDSRAYARLGDHDRDTLLALISAVPQWHWLLGNHDPALDPTLRGERHIEYQLGNIHLRHEPEKGLPAQIIGHFHPKHALRLGGQRVHGKALIHDARLMIMPAFGSYTGGLKVNEPAIASLLNMPDCYLLYRKRVWKV